MKKYIFILSILFSANLNAQNFNLSVDFAVFKLDSNKVRLELYYSFPDNAISYISVDETLVGKLKFNLEIKSNFRTEINENWEVPYSVNTIHDLKKMSVFGIRNFILNPGEYKVTIFAIDGNDTTRFGKSEIRIITNRFDDEKVTISDIELATIIEHETSISKNWNNMFYKNSLYVIPNPSIEISGNDLKIMAYYEIYGAKKYSQDSVKIAYYLLDALRNERIYYSKNLKSISDAMIDIVEMPIDAIPTGVYYLKVVVSNLKNNPIDSSTGYKKMFVINSNIAPELKTEFTENEQFEMSEFSTYGDERIDLEIRMLKKIAENFEKDEIELLGTTSAKQKYLFRYWKLKDIDKDTKRNLALEKFKESIQFSNTYFSCANQNGWETDRGEIYLKYGRPSNREQTIAVGEYKAYEEWWYQNVNGGSYFYFVDFLGIGNFQLVHSTINGYQYNPNWLKELVQGKKIEVSTPNSNSRSGNRTP